MTADVGQAFPLLLYHRVVARFRRPSFLIAILLLGLSLATRAGLVSWPPESGAPWLLAGGLVAGLFWVLTLVGPRLAYVQPRQDHIRLQTPIYRLRISYRRILTTRPVSVAKTFDIPSLSRSQRRLLEPLLGNTALTLDLKGYPLRPILLRLFFHPLFLTPDRTGFVLIVEDWMGLSEQISDHLEASRSERSGRQSAHFSDAARILAQEDE
jgi:hypothetical protein